LIVSNLPTNITEAKLREIFSKFGDIVSAAVVEGAGKGFINFQTHEQAVAAMSQLHL